MLDKHFGFVQIKYEPNISIVEKSDFPIRCIQNDIHTYAARHSPHHRLFRHAPFKLRKVAQPRAKAKKQNAKKNKL